MDISAQDIQTELDRRSPGNGVSSTTRKEPDQVEILSGIFEGKTTGTPICMIIHNRDVQSRAYDDLRDIFRPGHGDFTYAKKYGIRDHRGGGRASGRETAGRVAAGAIAKKVIGQSGIRVAAYTMELGGIVARRLSLDRINDNILYCPDPDASAKMEAKLADAKEKGDSLGGIVEILIQGCPAGLGEPVFDKMDADLAKALMSIGTVKGVEIGAGFAVSRMIGSECNDPIAPEGFKSNDAGGILAGITNGEAIVIRVACKPIPSIEIKQETIDTEGRSKEISIKGRHDVSVIPRVIPVCEAMASITIADHLLRQRAISKSWI
jgi:chorismate synthase